jgi:hypothetical protein
MINSDKSAVGLLLSAGALRHRGHRVRMIDNVNDGRRIYWDAATKIHADATRIPQACICNTVKSTEGISWDRLFAPLNHFEFRPTACVIRGCCCYTKPIFRVSAHSSVDRRSRRWTECESFSYIRRDTSWLRVTWRSRRWNDVFQVKPMNPMSFQSIENKRSRPSEHSIIHFILAAAQQRSPYNTSRLLSI